MAKHSEVYRWFGMMLYPDNDNHMKVLKYVTENRDLFPSYVYIRHLPEDYLEDMPDDLSVDQVDIAAEDLLPRSVNKVHYHVCFKTPRAISEASAVNLFVVKQDGKRVPLVSLVPHLYYPEGYFKYLLHWDLDSQFKDKHKYQITDMHGDPSIIGKLGATNTNFVSKGMLIITDWIMNHPGTTTMAFTVWLNTLHNKDPASWIMANEAFKSCPYWIRSIIRDWSYDGRSAAYAEVNEDEISDIIERNIKK